MFIKVTGTRSNSQVFVEPENRLFINMSSAQYFTDSGDGGSSTYIYFPRGDCLFVKETPEEIIKLIEAAKTPIVSINDSDFEGGLQVNACCHREDSK